MTHVAMDSVPAAEPTPSLRRRPSVWLLLAVIVAISGTAIATAMRHTSPTFDEIVFVAGGARGFETGVFDLAPDHPPLMQYVYGLPAWLDGVILPDETGITEDVRGSAGYRYAYSAALYFGVGNDPERVAFVGRIPAVLMALALVVLVFAFVRRYWGDGAGLLAAVLVAFLPDVLAHGGVAYGDVPVTLALFGAAWATDVALRTAAWRHALLAGALAGIAVSVKISAAILLPVAVVLALCELGGRLRTPEPDDASVRHWLQHLPLLLVLAAAATYLVIVAVYRGDFLLEEFRYGLDFRYRHMTRGHAAGAFLLGNVSTTGWWYFFPVAFLFKTSAGLHLLLVIALLVLCRDMLRTPAAVLRSHLRMPVAATVIFGAVLLGSSLNIGFRYALPVLPMVCVVTAVGAARTWRSATRIVRTAIVGAAAWSAVFALSYHPHFLPFISEYGPGRDRGHEVLVDSSLDWGQGLLELRNFMRDRDIRRVHLSYFGSAWPAGYGIEYTPLHSFFPLPPAAPAEHEPDYVVISATNLRGVYFTNDPFARFREIEPDTVLAHSLFVYRLAREAE